MGTAEGARAPADGYTLLLTSQGTTVFNLGLYKTLGYDPLKDLVPLNVTGTLPNVLVVSPTNPAMSVADLIAQACAMTSKDRSALLPDVPTMMQAEVPDFDVAVWLGFAVPTNTPGAIVSRLNAESNRVSQNLQVREKLLVQGFEMLPPTSPEAARKLIVDDQALWLPIIRQSGAKAE